MSSYSTSPVYLDHAATTPMRPEAIAAMTEELARLGNPSSLHAAGRRARRVVEESREQLAEVFGARPSEVVFTSGGTEADNLAVKGLYWARRDGSRRRVLTTSVEHHAVLDSVRWLEEAQGAEAVWLVPGADGMVRPEVLRAAIARAPEQVAVVSVMWANNEVGTVQPVSELAAVAHEYGVPFHTDAVQAAAQLPVDFAVSGADALTVTGHKLGGPVGVGALILARGVTPVPVLHGGGQERDIRSGTLDTPAIRAFAVAAAVCAKHRADEAERLAALRDDLVRQVLAAVPDAVLNGPPPGPDRLPGNAHFSFPGCEGDALLMLLDAERDRLLHRFGLHRGRGRAQPRAASHGRRRVPGPRFAPLLPRPHLHPARRGRPGPGHPRGRRPRPPRRRPLIPAHASHPPTRPTRPCPASGLVAHRPR